MVQRVLLAHSQNWYGISRLPRVLALAGLEVTYFGLPFSHAWKSRYVTQRIGASENLGTCGRELKALIEREGRHFALVLIADEPLLEEIARYAGEAWLDRCLPVDHRSDALRLIASKFAMIEAARAVGIPFPRSQVAHSVEDACALAAQMCFPLMVKRDSGSGGAGVRKVDNEAQMCAAIEEFGDHSIGIEEFVSGRSGLSEVLYDHGRLVCMFSAFYGHRFPTAFGPSATRETCHVPGVEAAAVAFGRLLGFHGFANLCWQYDAMSGRLAILEFNARAGAGMHLRPGPERLFSQGLRAMLAGRSAEYRSQPYRDGVDFRLFPQDLFRVLAQRDLLGILSWLPGLPSARDIPWSDPLLLRDFVYALLSRFCPDTVARLRALRRFVHAKRSV